jgi:predicted dehydrogenase
MAGQIGRRAFFGCSAGTGVAACAALASAGTRAGADARLVVGVMGVNGRGRDLAKGFATCADVEVAYVCDVDSRATEAAVAVLQEVQPRPAQGVVDFRRILDDPDVDILAIAAPNHWHAPAAILACQAGKHVYVEKPCSHTAQEGEWTVQAARRHDRVVTMGTQRRSWRPLMEAVEKLREGEIGPVRYARCWYFNRRGTIGRGRVTEPPEWLDFDLWQGPAPRREYKDNLVHYNWHWHWHWGNGELGNNGVHALDLARWGMGVDYPRRVGSAGGRYRFEDDQETPDTHVVTYDFGDKTIMWEGLSWSPMGPQGSAFGVSFHGDKGTMEWFDSGYRVFDMQRKMIGEYSEPSTDATHYEDFLHCIRHGGRPTADIEEGHRSTLLCHLGNIAHRVGRSLNTDPQNGHILDDVEANALWSREYAPGWEPRV